MEKSIKKIINQTLDHMNMNSKEAVEMIYKTGKAESDYRTLQQYGDGPALGFFQMEPATCKDILENYVKFRPKYKELLLSLGFQEDKMEFSLMSNIAFQVAMCRLHYRRVPFALPEADDLKGQAKYWKVHYNSHLGKGTIEHFMKANKK